MKLIHRLHYAAKRLRRNRRMQLFTTILTAAAFTLLYGSFIFLAGTGRGEKEVEDTLGVPLASCGNVDFQSGLLFSTDASWNAERFTRKAYALGEIGAFGNYHCGSICLEMEGETDYTARILEIQKSVEREFGDDDPSGIQAVDMNRELFGMHNISLIEGEGPQDGTENELLVYLGYDLREIPVGTVFKYAPANTSYKVAGIMAEGTRLTDEVALTYNFGDPLPYCIDMDKRLLLLLPEGAVFADQNLFCAADGYTYEAAAAALKKLGEEEGVLVKTGPLSARLETLFSFNRKLRKRLNTGVFVLCLTVTVACTAIQLLQVYIRRKELGIWLANGVSRAELLKILWLENVIRSMAAAVLAVPVTRLLLWFLFSGASDRRLILNIVSFMYRGPLLWLVLSALLLACIVSAVPVVVTAKRQAFELVKGIWG